MKKPKIFFNLAQKPGPMRDGSLREYFCNYIWPDRLAKMPVLEMLRIEIQRQIDQALTRDGRG